MRLGFSFKGVHSGEFDRLVVRTQDRPVRAQSKGEDLSALNAYGSYNFAEANPYGHEYFEDKIFQTELRVSAENMTELQRAMAKISRWITGSGELIFDDTPLVKWNARILEAVSYMPEHGTTAALTVKYRVLPYAEMIFDTLDGPYLDSDIEIDSDLPLDISMYFTFTGAGTHNVWNMGDLPVRPVIRLTGASGDTKIVCNGFDLSVPANAVIDCEKFTVEDSAGNNLIKNVSGNFFEFSPGNNAMAVSGCGKSAKIEVKYCARYIHNVDDFEMGFE